MVAAFAHPNWLAVVAAQLWLGTHSTLEKGRPWFTPFFAQKRWIT